MATHGDIWWTELMASDIAKARAFYAKLLGWQPHVAAMGDMQREAQPGEPSYTLFMKDGKPVCGGMSLGDVGMSEGMPHWFTYMAVDDVEAACAKTKAAGGKVLREPFDVPGVGRIAILTDPDGAAFGVGKPTG